MSDTAHEPRIPSFFAEALEEQYGTALETLIERGCYVTRATTLRANTLLSSREEIASILDDAGIAHRTPAWYPDAFVVDPNDARAVWELPAIREGKLYLQSLSSMLPPLLMGDCAGLDVLDMCAAPGGKTTELSALNGGKARITACEMNAPRADKLEFNLKRQGTRNVVVMRSDARRLDSFFRFDRIMLDAPCSGSGTLDMTNPKTAKHFTPALVQKSTKSQSALLAKALELLKPGGTLVYSTCSVLKQENEDLVRAALKRASRNGAYEIVPVKLTGATFAAAADAPTDLATGEQPAVCASPNGLGQLDCASPDEGDQKTSRASLGDAGQEASWAASPDALPTLPTTLEGALTLCPTPLFEGFFVAKIKRLS